MTFEQHVVISKAELVLCTRSVVAEYVFVERFVLKSYNTGMHPKTFNNNKAKQCIFYVLLDPKISLPTIQQNPQMYNFIFLYIIVFPVLCNSKSTCLTSFIYLNA